MRSFAHVPLAGASVIPSETLAGRWTSERDALEQFFAARSSRLFLPVGGGRGFLADPGGGREHWTGGLAAVTTPAPDTPDADWRSALRIALAAVGLRAAPGHEIWSRREGLWVQVPVLPRRVPSGRRRPACIR